ncbi:MAG: phenylalanine--tRNA ligase subunit alpha [Buchnera aphidicola (Chaetogeoica yunlongensis)]
MCEIDEYIKFIKTKIRNVTTIQELNLLRNKYLKKPSYFFSKILKISYAIYNGDKRYCKMFNKFKSELNIEFDLYKKKIESMMSCNFKNSNNIDVSLICRRNDIGTLHPLTLVMNKIEKFFIKLGFSIIEGPEIDDEYHNFDALNIPKHHPARTTHDTFWFDSIRLLRTQTSNMQVRIMKNEKIPIRIITPGKVYRNDHDITHTPMFHQIEGLVVDSSINFLNLKWIIEEFLKYFFGNKIRIRFRASYFPFTVLSTEVDILGNNKKWLEILGCGMIHPKVLFNSNISVKKYSGFAFGMGVERIAMLYYGIPDIRVFFDNNLKFLKQFK